MILTNSNSVHDEEKAAAPQMATAVYETIGQITSLLAHSPMHRHFTVNDITDLLMPPVILDQYRIYKANNGTAVGFVAWGMLDPGAEAKLLNARQVLEFSEWRSGKQPFRNRLHCPFRTCQDNGQRSEEKYFCQSCCESAAI